MTGITRTVVGSQLPSGREADFTEYVCSAHNPDWPALDKSFWNKRRRWPLFCITLQITSLHRRPRAERAPFFCLKVFDDVERTFFEQLLIEHRSDMRFAVSKAARHAVALGVLVMRVLPSDSTGHFHRATESSADLISLLHNQFTDGAFVELLLESLRFIEAQRLDLAAQKLGLSPLLLLAFPVCDIARC